MDAQVAAGNFRAASEVLQEAKGKRERDRGPVKHFNRNRFLFFPVAILSSIHSFFRLFFFLELGHEISASEISLMALREAAARNSSADLKRHWSAMRSRQPPVPPTVDHFTYVVQYTCQKYHITGTLFLLFFRSFLSMFSVMLENSESLPDAIGLRKEMQALNIEHTSSVGEMGSLMMTSSHELMFLFLSLDSRSITETSWREGNISGTSAARRAALRTIRITRRPLTHPTFDHPLFDSSQSTGGLFRSYASCACPIEEHVSSCGLCSSRTSDASKESSSRGSRERARSS